METSFSGPRKKWEVSGGRNEWGKSRAHRYGNSNETQYFVANLKEM